MLEYHQHECLTRYGSDAEEFPTDPTHAAHNPSPGIIVEPHFRQVVCGLTARNLIVGASLYQTSDNTVLNTSRNLRFDVINDVVKNKAGIDV